MCDFLGTFHVLLVRLPTKKTIFPTASHGQGTRPDFRRRPSREAPWCQEVRSQSPSESAALRGSSVVSNKMEKANDKSEAKQLWDRLKEVNKTHLHSGLMIWNPTVFGRMIELSSLPPVRDKRNSALDVLYYVSYIFLSPPL